MGTKEKETGRETNKPLAPSICLLSMSVCPCRTPCQSERADGETAGDDEATGDETIRPVCLRVPRSLLVKPQAHIAEDANRECHTDGMRNGRNRIVDDEEHREILSACLFPFDNIYITAKRARHGAGAGQFIFLTRLWRICDDIDLYIQTGEHPLIYGLSKEKRTRKDFDDE